VLQPAQCRPDERSREVHAQPRSLRPGDGPHERVRRRRDLPELAAPLQILEKQAEDTQLLLALGLPEGFGASRGLGTDLPRQRDLEQAAAVGLGVEAIGQPRPDPVVGLPEGARQGPNERLRRIVGGVEDLAGLEEPADAEMVLPQRRRLAEKGSQ
jgi:hypothetical protein